MGTMKVLCLVLLVAVAAQAENCQVYKNGIESIFSKMPVVKSASEPNDGVCEDGEGWGWIASPRSEWTPMASRSVLRRQSEQLATAGTAFAGCGINRTWLPHCLETYPSSIEIPLDPMPKMPHCLKRFLLPKNPICFKKFPLGLSA